MRNHNNFNGQVFYRVDLFCFNWGVVPSRNNKVHGMTIPHKITISKSHLSDIGSWERTKVYHMFCIFQFYSPSLASRLIFHFL